MFDNLLRIMRRGRAASALLIFHGSIRDNTARCNHVCTHPPLIHITHLAVRGCQEHAAVSGNDVAFGGTCERCEREAPGARRLARRNSDVLSRLSSMQRAHVRRCVHDADKGRARLPDVTRSRLSPAREHNRLSTRDSA